MTAARTSIVALLAVACLAQPARAETPAATPAATEAADALAATTQKFNAYVEYMNRTLRVSSSLDRYRSWVNMRTGPTGRERLIYGAYEVYDTKDEKAAAEKAMAAAPHLPDLDEAMAAYIKANDAVAPVLNKAAGYYQREDYKVDHMQRGKELHADIVALGGAFLAARARLEAVMTKQKLALDQIRLATIEKHEGRNARWHAGNVMMRAKQALDALETGNGGQADGKGGTVDMPAFDAAMKDLGTAVAGLDDYKAEHPRAFSGFASFPDGFLGRLREIDGRLQRTHGNLRRAAGLDMTFVLNDYNTMVTLSSLPGQFKDD